MSYILIAFAAAAASMVTPVLAGDVAISVSIGQPSFYGRIDIGGYPEPQVIYRQPRIVERVVVERPPIYLRVPPGHAKHWSKHCHKYNACGEQVYFVQDNWYQREYVPRYQEQHLEHQDERDDDERGHHKDKKDKKNKKDKGHGNKHDKDHDRD